MEEMKLILSILAALLLVASGIACGTEPAPYEEALDLMMRVYLPGTGAQAITQGDEVVICLTNPEEDATVAGINDLQDRIGRLAKELARSYHIKKVIAHIQFACGDEIRHYTLDVSVKINATA